MPVSLELAVYASWDLGIVNDKNTNTLVTRLDL
jgi:hypothetical protein